MANGQIVSFFISLCNCSDSSDLKESKNTVPIAFSKMALDASKYQEQVILIFQFQRCFYF